MLIFLTDWEVGQTFGVKNKCLLEINKKTLIENSINEILKTKIKDITVVLGFKPDLIKNKLKNYKNINFILN